MKTTLSPNRMLIQWDDEMVTLVEPATRLSKLETRVWNDLIGEIDADPDPSHNPRCTPLVTMYAKAFCRMCRTIKQAERRPPHRGRNDLPHPLITMAREEHRHCLSILRKIRNPPLIKALAMLDAAIERIERI